MLVVVDQDVDMEVDKEVEVDTDGDDDQSCSLCIHVCQTAPRVNCRQFEGDQLQGKASTSLLSSLQNHSNKLSDQESLEIHHLLKRKHFKGRSTLVKSTLKFYHVANTKFEGIDHH